MHAAYKNLMTVFCSFLVQNEKRSDMFTTQ